MLLPCALPHPLLLIRTLWLLPGSGLLLVVLVLWLLSVLRSASVVPALRLSMVFPVVLLIVLCVGRSGDS